MAISNATRLSDFGSGIGTQGTVIQVDNANARLGVGTTIPQAMLQVGTGVSVYGDSGIVSATTFYGDGSNLTGIAATDYINTNSVNSSGIITASSFSGDGSGLSGVSGFGSAFDNTAGTLGNLIYETPRNFYQTGVTSVHVDAETSSGDIAFSRLNEIRLGTGATMHIGAGTTLIMNVLNLF